MPTKKKSMGSAVRISAKVKTKTMRTRSSVAKRTITAEKIPSRIGFNIGMHLVIAGSAIAVLMLLGIVDRVTFSTLLSSAANETVTTIGLEFTEPLQLSVLVARKSQTGYASVKNQSKELIHLSVPLDWKRTEVSGAAIEEIVQDEPTFGFVRWTLPAGAEIRFLTGDVPSSLTFSSTSKSTAAVDIKTIDLEDSSVSDQTVLLKEKVLARLWGTEE